MSELFVRINPQYDGRSASEYLPVNDHGIWRGFVPISATLFVTATTERGEKKEKTVRNSTSEKNIRFNVLSISILIHRDNNKKENEF